MAINPGDDTHVEHWVNPTIRKTPERGREIPMQLTRKIRSLARRLGQKLYRTRVDHLTRRADLKKRIADLQEGGRIAIVYGGIDYPGAGKQSR